MKKFVYIYYNNGTRDGLTADQSKQEWGAWFGKLGDKLVDAGNPFNGGKAVEKSGVTTIENWAATGYSIVNAADMDEATSLAKDCPVLEEPDGAVRVHEALPM